MNRIALMLQLITALCCCVLPPSVTAQASYPAGTCQLPPEIDLHLQPVDVIIPEQFSHLPDTLSLNLPAGFTARVFPVRRLALDTRDRL